MSYGEKILQFRADNNLTQQECADILGTSVNMVFRYEHNVSKPSAVNALRIEKRMKNWEAEKNGK